MFSRYFEVVYRDGVVIKIKCLLSLMCGIKIISDVDFVLRYLFIVNFWLLDYWVYYINSYMVVVLTRVNRLYIFFSIVG